MTDNAFSRPDAEILVPLRRLMQFMETGDTSVLAGIFASSGVSLIDSFPPYSFNGADAPAQWAAGFQTHVRNITNLQHSFGDTYEFSRTEDTVFLSQSIGWTGQLKTGAFRETGGLAVILVKEGDHWRIRNFGWAVTEFEQR